MKITDSEVNYVAKLGRLSLSHDEKTKYLAQLDDILRYMDMLAEVDVSEVKPMAGPVELFTPLRKDVVRASLPIEKALSNAPDKAGDSFKVPKVIDHG